MREINRIVIHHTATSSSATVESIRRYHTAVRGWRDIGYHYLIDGDGQIRLGRPEWIQGAHVRGHNRDSIGVAVIGNFEQVSFELAQEDSLEVLLLDLLYRYPKAKVLCHSDLANTLCPGVSLSEWVIAWRRE